MGSATPERHVRWIAPHPQKEFVLDVEVDMALFLRIDRIEAHCQTLARPSLLLEAHRVLGGNVFSYIWIGVDFVDGETTVYDGVIGPSVLDVGGVEDGHQFIGKPVRHDRIVLIADDVVIQECVIAVLDQPRPIDREVIDRYGIAYSESAPLVEETAVIRSGAVLQHDQPSQGAAIFTNSFQLFIQIVLILDELRDRIGVIMLASDEYGELPRLRCLVGTPDSYVADSLLREQTKQFHSCPDLRRIVQASKTLASEEIE